MLGRSSCLFYSATLCYLIIISSFIFHNSVCQSLSSPVAQQARSNHKLRPDRMAPIDRQIKGCQTIEEALVLLHGYMTATPKQHLSDDPFLAVMHICGKHKQWEQAQAIYNTRPSEACQRLLIQICGKCHQPNVAVQILRQNQHPSIGTYHATMSACGQAGAWETVLDLLDELHRKEDGAATTTTTSSCSTTTSTTGNLRLKIYTSTLTYNVALTALARSKRGMEALGLLNQMKDPSTPLPFPDQISYHKTIMALCTMGKIDAAFALCATDCPNDTAASDMIISAYGKRDEWDMVKKVQSTLHRTPGTHDFELWHEGDTMVKVGKGRSAYWKLGMWSDELSNIGVALQPHRNPSKNGIKLLLLNEHGQRIGYLLMINSSITVESSMLGAYIDPQERKRGLSKIIIGVWMSICLHAGVRPITGTINKPLLALVLQETFGFVPRECSGVHVEVSRGPNGEIVLYSSTKAIQGSFSPPDIKRENIIFADTHATPKGRMVKVQASFDPPTDEVSLKRRLDQVLKGSLGNGVFTHSQSAETLRLILLGK